MTFACQPIDVLVSGLVNSRVNITELIATIPTWVVGVFRRDFVHCTVRLYATGI